MIKEIIIVLLMLFVVAGCNSFVRSKDACRSCGGSGKDTYMTADYHVYSRVCPICAGTGKETR